MSTNDKLRIFDYSPNVEINAAFTPRVDVELTPEQIEMMRAAARQYGPSLLERALPAIRQSIALDNFTKRFKDNDR